MMSLPETVELCLDCCVKIAITVLALDILEDIFSLRVFAYRAH